MPLHWRRVFGLGAALWLIVFATLMAFQAAGWQGSWVGQVVTAGLAALLAYWLSPFARAQTGVQALLVGFAWAASGMVLDWVVTWQYVPAIFSQWNVWAGYAFMLAMPTFRLGAARRVLSGGSL